MLETQPVTVLIASLMVGATPVEARKKPNPAQARAGGGVRSRPG
jgi:hypothetical protein